jgi:hypothetical protein
VKYGGRLALAIVVIGIALIRLRLADAPIERDEGEYAYAGQLILDGVPPYALVYNMKFPGTYYAYSLVLALFGQSSWGVHAGLLIVNAASTILIYLIGRRLLGEFGGLVASIIFAVMTLDQGVLGAYAHATHFIVLPVLGGALLVLRAGEFGNRLTWLTSGLLFGLAGLMSQKGVFFVPFGLALVFSGRARSAAGPSEPSTRAAVLFAAGAGLPFAIVAVVLAAQGVLGKALFWTFGYAGSYVAETPMSEAWSMLSLAWPDVARVTLPFWILGGAGAVAVSIGRWPAATRVFCLGLAAAGALAVAPGLYFRNHYFVLLLPAVALLGAAALMSLERWLGSLTKSSRAARAIAVLIPAGLVAAYAIQEQAYLFGMNGPDLTRATYGTNPFTEAGPIARYLADHTTADDRIAVLGSEPEIYFHAHRRAATGYVYTYPLLEAQPYAPRMRQEMVDEIQSARPKYLVAVWVRNSWINSLVADQRILEWSKRYAQQCYDLVGIADIGASGTTMVWDGEAASYQPRSQDLIYTLRRKSDAPCKVQLSQ